MQIHNIAYITLGKSSLRTIQQAFDPGLPVSFHLTLLQTSAEKGTIPTLYVIQTDRHCMPTAGYYFSSIKPDPIVIPPHLENNDTVLEKQQQTEDPTAEDPSPLRPGETRVYPAAIATNATPVLDLTNTTVTSKLDLCAAFYSLNLCSLDTHIRMAEKNLCKINHNPITYWIAIH